MTGGPPSGSPGDEAALAKALGDHLQLAPDTLKSLGQAHFQHLCAHHEITHYREAYLSLIEQKTASSQKWI
jgi:hypothetical protein